jgi:2,4-diketo-3-deoxy-L-fuconate hydrolase
MRLCRFDKGYGLVSGDRVTDISAFVPLDGLPDDHTDPLIAALPALRALDAAALAACPSRAIGDVACLSPVRRPGKILAAPNNYREHTAEMHEDAAANAGRSGALEAAGFFLKATTSLVGPSEGIVIRFPDRRTDHEVELVIVMGQKIDRPVSAKEAMATVAAYGVGLDITLRGPEERSLRKSIDTYTVLGPTIVTADEAGDMAKARMWLSVNGEMRQSVPLSDMVYDIGEQIAYASRFYTLYPGDLIYTGTPAGVGPIRPGDLIKSGIDGLDDLVVAVR